MPVTTFEKLGGLNAQEQVAVSDALDRLKKNRQLEVEFGEVPRSLDAVFMLLNIAITIKDSLAQVPEDAEFFQLNKITFAKKLNGGVMSYTWEVTLEVETARNMQPEASVIPDTQKVLTTLLKSVREHPDNRLAKRHLLTEIRNLEALQRFAEQGLIPGILTYSVAKPDTITPIPDTPKATFILTEWVEGPVLSDLEKYADLKQAYLGYAETIDYIAEEAGLIHSDIKAVNALFERGKTIVVDWSGAFILGSNSPKHPVLRSSGLTAEDIHPRAFAPHPGNFVPELPWNAEIAYQFSKRSMMFSVFKGIFNGSLAAIAKRLVPSAELDEEQRSKEARRLLTLLSTPDSLCSQRELAEKLNFEPRFRQVLTDFLENKYQSNRKPLSTARAIDLANLIITELTSEKFTDSMHAMVTRVFDIIDK